MNRNRIIFLAVIILCLAGQPCWAAKAYVTDSFEITLRTGPTVQNKVIATPSSGQALEVLKTEGGWSNVRVLANGENEKEGWVLSRYLVTRLPWKKQAHLLREEASRLKEELIPMGNKLEEMVNKEKNLSTELQGTDKALQKLQREHEDLKKGSAGYLKLKEKHTEVQSKLASVQAKLQILTKENERLKTSERNKWFLTGALVLLSGLIIGLIMGKRQKKRMSSLY